jgi:ABC-type lipoprotein export system ATPase subunit
MEDLKDSQLSRMIMATLVLTGEVTQNLRSVLISLSGTEGRGIFLKGHFGSGKSHFLAMISLLLKASQAWQNVLSPRALF